MTSENDVFDPLVPFKWDCMAVSWASLLMVLILFVIGAAAETMGILPKPSLLFELWVFLMLCGIALTGVFYFIGMGLEVIAPGMYGREKYRQKSARIMAEIRLKQIKETSDADD